jgi:hypothetical protein
MATARALQNPSQTSLESDMVFSDGYSLQLGTVTGGVDDGMTATLSVPRLGARRRRPVWAPPGVPC